jgi:hypothetical protein
VGRKGRREKRSGEEQRIKEGEKSGERVESEMERGSRAPVR